MKSRDTNSESRFHSIYSEWGQAIFRYLYYKTGDIPLSEDLVQDLFVKVWEKLDTIRVGEEKNYLYTMARNMLINKSAHDKVVLKFEHQQKHSSNQETPAFQLEVKEYNQRLELAISSLSEGQREVFLLSRMEGHKYKEIATLLGISQKAVEKRMHLAISKLKKILGRKI